MYPTRELKRLASHKLALRRDITRVRAQCVDAAVHAAKPLEWTDRVARIWRQLSPLTRFAAIPVALVVQRAIAPRSKILRLFVRWGPLLVGATRMANTALKARGDRVRPSTNSA